MKKDKGITLTYLIIYIVLIFFVLAIITRVSVYFTNNMSEISKDSSLIGELDKFNLYFLQETKKTNNDIINISGDRQTINFSSGCTFEFSSENSSIYLKEEDKAIVISEGIEKCEFLQRKENDKKIITAEITINNQQKSYEYVMGYENVYKTYQNEEDYIYNTIINNVVNNATNNIVNNNVI